MAGELKCVRVRLVGPSSREQVLSDPATPLWSFRVPLGEDEFLVAEGCLESDRSNVDLISFANVLTRTYVGNRERWASVAFH